MDMPDERIHYFEEPYIESVEHDVDPEYDFRQEMMNQLEHETEQAKEIEQRIQLDELRRQVDELKEQIYEHTAIQRDEHRLLERFEMMFRGRFISEPLAMRMMEIIRDRMERSPTTAMEQRIRALEAERYMNELKTFKFKVPFEEPKEEEVDFIQKGEMEV